MLQVTKGVFKLNIFKTIKDKIIYLLNNKEIAFRDLVYLIMGICLSRSSIIGEMFPCAIAFLCVYYYIKGPSFIMLIASIASIISVKVDVRYIVLCVMVYLYYLIIKKRKKSNLIIDIFCFSLVNFAVSVGLIFYDGYNLRVLFIAVFEMLFIISVSLILHEVLMALKKNVFNINSTACLLTIIFIAILGFKEIQLLSFKVLMFMTFFSIIFVSSYISQFAGMILGFAFGLFSFSNLDESAFYMIALGFGGMCSGILKDKIKPLAGFVFVFVSSALLLYFDKISLYQENLSEIIVAVMLYTIISFAFNSKLIKFAGANDFYEKKVQNAAIKLGKLSTAINEFGKTYDSYSSMNSKKDYDIETSINNVYGKVCVSCSEIDKCWKNNYNKIYCSVAKTTNNILKNKNNIDMYLRHNCSKNQDVVKEIYITVKDENESDSASVENKTQENTIMNQLMETSEIINDTLKEIKHIDLESKKAREEINRMLKDESIIIKNVEVSEKKDMTNAIVTITTTRSMDDACKLITEAIKSISGLYMKCSEKIVSSNKYYVLRFNSLKRISAKGYYAKLTKENSEMSGDNYAFGTLNNKYYGVLSDGMGTGERAYDESKNAIKLLVKLLDANFGEEQMISTLNSLLMLKMESDRYVTLDLSIIDYEKHELRMYKAGAAQSYIIRDGEIKKITSNSLPIGILDSFECYTYKTSIKRGDTVIMVTDGIIDSVNENELKSLDKHLGIIKQKEPQNLANSIVSYAVKGTTKIIDDMTVIVIKII